MFSARRPCIRLIDRDIDASAGSVEVGQCFKVLVERTMEHADQAAAVLDFAVGKRLEGEHLQVADVAAVRQACSVACGL